MELLSISTVSLVASLWIVRENRNTGEVHMYPVWGSNQRIRVVKRVLHHAALFLILNKNDLFFKSMLYIKYQHTKKSKNI